MESLPLGLKYTILQYSEQWDCYLLNFTLCLNPTYVRKTKDDKQLAHTPYKTILTVFVAKLIELPLPNALKQVQWT